MRIVSILLLSFILLFHPNMAIGMGRTGIQSDTLMHRHGPPLAASIVLFEVFATGFSAYAAAPQYYGNKVMGGIYGVSAILMPIMMLNEYMDHGKIDEQFIPDVVTTLGISYGLSRLATYNLLRSGNDGADKRLIRNLIEFHTTYLVPFAIGGIAGLYLKHRHQPNNKVSVYFTGNGFILNVKL